MKTGIIVFSLVLLMGCQPQSKPATTTMDLLIGSWVLPDHSGEQRTFIETWKKENDSTFMGSAYVVNGKTSDTFNNELLWLERRGSSWEFIAHPSGQQKTAFALTEEEPMRLRFENPQHDFPQFIEYSWTSADTIIARIGDTASAMSIKMVRLQE